LENYNPDTYPGFRIPTKYKKKHKLPKFLYKIDQKLLPIPLLLRLHEELLKYRRSLPALQRENPALHTKTTLPIFFLSSWLRLPFLVPNPDPHTVSK
jgi:hypothetical protein